MEMPDGDGDPGRDVRVLLAAMGGPDYPSLAASSDGFGPGTCEIVLRAAVGEYVGQFGVPGAHGRTVHEDFGGVLSLAASHWPQRFAELVAADVRLSRNGTVLWALGWADCDLSAQLLIDATKAKAPGDQHNRWAALKGLQRLASPALPDVLTSLVKDRAHVVRDAAVFAAIGYGDARLVPHLHRVATAERTQPGTRAAAWDAIEAIKIREGLTDVPAGPHSGRLVAVRRAAGDEPAWVLWLDPSLTFNTELYAGKHIATVRTGTVEIRVQAPCHGRIAAVLMIPHRPVPPVLAWIRANPRP